MRARRTSGEDCAGLARIIIRSIPTRRHLARHTAIIRLLTYYAMLSCAMLSVSSQTVDEALRSDKPDVKWGGIQYAPPVR
jgi:hypothetical protein